MTNDIASLLDKELLPFKRGENNSFDIWGDIAAGRQMADAAAAQMLAQHSPVGRVDQQDVLIPGPENEPIRLRVFKPEGVQTPAPLLLWMHGGGFVMGSLDMDTAYLQRLCIETSCAVVSVDYRLAPEAPFPAALEDCYAALVWVADHGVERGLDSNRIAVGGLSGGGGLAAALSLYARDQGNSPVQYQLLLCPMLDDRNTTASSHMELTGLAWDRRNNINAWGAYLEGRVPAGEVYREHVSPYAAPARADDLSNLPPAFISVGSVDLFMDENINFARRLVACGVKADLHVYAGAFHAFECIAGGSAVAERANRQIFAALRNTFST